MRRYAWLPFVLVVIGLLGYKIVWPWLRERADHTAVDAVIADLREQTRRAEALIADFPRKPGRDDLGRLTAFLEEQREVQERAEAVSSRVRGERVVPFRDALTAYSESITRLRDRMKQILADLKDAPGR